MKLISRSATLLTLLVLPVLATAQNVLSIGDGSALPGDSVFVNVEISHDALVLWFSYGSTHDVSVFTPIEIAQVSALLPLKGGTGAD